PRARPHARRRARAPGSARLGPPARSEDPRGGRGNGLARGLRVERVVEGPDPAGGQPARADHAHEEIPERLLPEAGALVLDHAGDRPREDVHSVVLVPPPATRVARDPESLADHLVERA